jgi:RNA polymerase sigma-70 factor (ECF subfamily)
MPRALATRIPQAEAGSAVRRVDSWNSTPTPTSAQTTSIDARATLGALHHDAWRWALLCCADDRQAARDVLHDVYVKVLDGRARYAGRSSFKTWLFGVIRLTARSTRRRRLLGALLFTPIGSAADPPSPHPEPERTLDARRARDAIAALRGRQRAVAELVFLRDMTLAEAAEAMGVSLGAARQHYARAKTRLREALSLRPEADDDR